MPVTIRITLPPYLRQWLINAHGGEEPVKFQKGSAFSSLLRLFIRNKREREEFVRPSEDTVEIVVPKFPGKDPEYHNYLPKPARQNLQDLIRDSFDVELYSELKNLSNIGRRMNDILYSWMEEKGIEPTDRNYEAVSKRMKILRARERDRERKKESYRKIKQKNYQ